MKKVLISTIALSLVFSLVPMKVVEAINFDGQEEKYMQLCSSSNLTNDNKSTCQDFNTYLKKKNKNLASTLKKQKNEANKTASSLEEAQAMVDEIDSDIKKKNEEIKYVEKTIVKTQEGIDQSNKEVKDRMYVMQSYVNDTSFIDYIFGAQDFVDMLSRIDSYKQLTQNDEELIQKLLAQKKEIEEQKEALNAAKKVLEQQKQEQVVVLKQFEELLEKQKQAIAATQNAMYDYGEATESLSAAIDQFNQEAYEVAVPQAKPEPPKPVAPPVQTPVVDNTEEANSNQENTEANSQPDSNTPQQTEGENNSQQQTQQPQTNVPTVSTLGYDIYKAAESRLGCRYYWGANGPDYFDCSGLVYWCLNKAGYKVGRTTAAGYSRAFSGVSWANSQTGDLACFGTSSVTHIGIVMLNSDGTRSLIHAGGGNSKTFGNNPNACVKISSFEPGSYYYKRIITIRRVQ